ncbi:MAG TPA: hypothetical protein VG713_07955 [Pirellulales bacterium]|nr:hypothetical protein [Pirellulales bacterium]
MPRRFRNLWQASRYYGYRAISRGLGLHVSRVFILDLKRTPPITADRYDLTYRFLTADDVWSFAADPANDLEASMVDRLADGNDLCFAALDGSTLVNYNWYAISGVEAEHAMGVPIRFGNDTAYLYKAYTRPEYRGRGINFPAVVRAFHALHQRGVRRVMGIVECVNWSSLASYGHFQPQQLGRLITLGHRKPWWAHYPRGAAAEAIEFGKTPSERCARSPESLTAVEA